MVVTYNATSQSTGSTQSSQNLQDQYSLEYISATTYKFTDNIQIFENGTSHPATYQVYVLKNGSLAAITETRGGQNLNLTGSEAPEIGREILGAFVFQAQLIDNLGTYTETNSFHSIGSSMVSIGSNTIAGTTYVANILPETITNCDGSTSDLTAFSITVGTPAGATYPLAVSTHYAGSTTSGGVTTTSNIYVQVTAVAVAS
jgi:hypothetical protein